MIDIRTSTHWRPYGATTARIAAVAVLCSMAIATAAAALEVTFDAGFGVPVTIIDNGLGDDNLIDPGVIDFDLTGSPVEGVFAAAGRVTEFVTFFGSLVSLSGPPLGQAVLRNVGGADGTFVVTIKSSTSLAPVGPTLGWQVLYVGAADDPTPAPVDIPAHAVTLTVNYDTTPISLYTLAGAALTAPGAISESERGSDLTATATSVQIDYELEPGPGDRVLLSGAGVQGFVFNQEEKCIFKLNKQSRGVAKAAAKRDRQCVQAAAFMGGDITACVDNAADAKTDSAENRVFSDFGKFCTPLPVWGVNGATCCEDSANDGAACTTDAECPGGACLPGACIGHAAERSANDVTHQLFGTTVTVDPMVSACQATVLKRAGKVLDARWKEFVSCKRSNVFSITNDPDLVAACLAPQPDPKTKIADAEAKLAQTVTQCNLSPIGPSFPGACTSVGDAAFAGCVEERIRCSFCLAVNKTDGIVPPLDCDVFDDGTVNASCS